MNVEEKSDQIKQIPYGISDYGKLRHLIFQDKDKTLNENFNQLKEIVENGGTRASIVESFPLEQLSDANNFKSLLFYFGLLTIKGPDRDKLRLGIPNETAKQLYYDYINAAYRETDVFSIDQSKYTDLMTSMACKKGFGKTNPAIHFG